MTDADAMPVPPVELPAHEGEEGGLSLLERQRQILASPGYHGMALKDRVLRMGYLFQGNVAQYKSLVTSLQDPGVSLPIMDLRDPDAHDQLLSEAERLLHNVLTSMSTRVDQQRAFMEKYLGDDAVLMKEYRDGVAAAFMGDPATTFLKGLRNYITHHQLPAAQTRQTLGGDSFSITFILPCEPLLRWDKWSSGTRRWIDGYGEAVPIVDVVDSYARTASTFDKWLYERIGRKYAAEIAVFLREREAHDRDVAKVFGL